MAIGKLMPACYGAPIMETEEIEDFKRSRLTWSDDLQVGETRVSCEQVLELLGPMLTDERKAKLEAVVENRSLEMVSVLENIYDRGNVSAAMRSSEAFGFMRMCLVDDPSAKFKAANRVTRGADKWLDVRSYGAPGDAVRELKSEGYQIWTTDLNTDVTIDTLDWSKKIAIVLGNEKDGVSPEMHSLVDGRFRIPMMGFTQSFNISVAAALLFYRAHLETRGRLLNAVQRRQALANYYLRCFDNPESLLRAKLGLTSR